jgi:hypothetical protein
MSRIISPVPLVLTISINQMSGEVKAASNREFNMFMMVATLLQLALQYLSMGIQMGTAAPKLSTENPTEQPTENPTEKPAPSHVAWLDAKEDKK